MEIFPEILKKLWNLWEIRSLLILSLSLQIILILFDYRRKINNPQSWIGILLKVIIWCAYISADWVATVALSITGNQRFVAGIWAPFLLLHLGGPDTITAYSLEDNELWLRHFLGLIVQVGVAFYVFLTFWSSNAFTFLAIPVFITGIVKYGERTWVLWSSSSQRFKDSLRLSLKRLSLHRCIELFEYETDYNRNIVMQEGINIEDHNLVQAFYSYKSLAYIIANQIFYDYRNYNYIIINGKSAEDAFKLVAIELGLMYDVLYTKAVIVYSRFGIWLCCITSISSVSALVLFSVIIDVHSYPLIDIIVTYLLLAGAVLLEIYAFVVFFSSDWTKLWLVKFKVAPLPHHRISKPLVDYFLRFTSCLHSCFTNNKRWSNSIGQYSLINSVLKERQCTYFGLEKLFCTSKLFEKHQYLTWENVNISLQEAIFEYLKEIADELHENENEIDDFYFRLSCNETLSKKGEHALKDYRFGDLLVAEEYDTRIIMWNIVTDKCYKNDLNHVDDETNKLHQNCKISKWLSDYMLYLLLFCPSMLPKGIDEIRYERTYVDATLKITSYKNPQRMFEEATDVASSSTDHESATVGVASNEDPRSVFKRATDLYLRLGDDENGWNKRWDVISEVWLEMLTYAAQNCDWKEHAHHLRKGGELLTHVSVLMVNFRLYKQHRPYPFVAIDTSRFQLPSIQSLCVSIHRLEGTGHPWIDDSHSFSVTLPLPKRQAFFVRSTRRLSTPSMKLESDQSTSKSIPSSVNDVSITELYPC
ncbi:hypothetical protein Dsin_020743 [Dipteronia sinensis]|uniref:DUF4220 domain-containing protein n=1 Tax=Dipteronia sinensis TaxID=43782 RepID=A0AAE0E3T1_9ROSI|nr:hypothetical protein Dsin_020743 [Dipteronia sinensis]